MPQRDWSSDVCSSDLLCRGRVAAPPAATRPRHRAARSSKSLHSIGGVPCFERGAPYRDEDSDMQRSERRNFLCPITAALCTHGECLHSYCIQQIRNDWLG